MSGTKFFRPGITTTFVVPTVADLAAVTVAEMATAQDISCDIADMTGLTYKNEPLETPTLCDTFIPSVPGPDKAESPTLTFYEQRDTAAQATANPLRLLFAKGERLILIVFPYGLMGAAPATGDVYDAWDVQSTGTPREWDLQKTAARWMAACTALRRPAEDRLLS